jgi:hypothetical protein
MPQTEREDEVQARDLIERVEGVSLRHADTHGGADYRFDRSGSSTGAVEVTTVTDGSLKSTQKAWMKLRERECAVPNLQSSWNVTVDEQNVRFNGIVEALEPALEILERAGLDRYDSWNRTEMWVERPELRDAVQVFMEFGVSNAWVVPTKDPDLRRLFFSTMGGWSAKGSDSSLQLIEAELRAKPDNYRKLRDADVDECHLFVWLDSQTPGEIARPFTGGGATEYDHFGLPNRPPNADEIVDVLWIVHRGTGNGWIWRRDGGWASVAA